jgi:hypothetical protein
MGAAETDQKPGRQSWKWIGATVFVSLIAFLWILGSSHKDTEDVVFPDLRDRTKFRMGLLQSYIDSLDNLGHLPRTVQELTSDLARDGRGSLRLDAWDRPFAFTRSDGGYEVRSAGPDGNMGTVDDLTMQGKAR